MALWRRTRTAASSEDKGPTHEWVRLAACDLDDVREGTSGEAEGIVEMLAECGIEDEQRRFVIPDPGRTSMLTSADRIRVEVLVRRPDLGSAREQLDAYEREWGRR